MIEKYVAILNPRALNVADNVLLNVTLSGYSIDAVKKFGEAISRFEEVQEAFLMTGSADYFLRVAVSGTAAYEEFLSRKLLPIGGIGRSNSSFALRCVKYSTALPLNVVNRRTS